MKNKLDKEKKTTSEKPVSLSPLNFKDALEALLKVRLEEEKKKIENNKRSNKG